ncbi:hypothetical protein PUN28_013756 [Cardiocondyla obscurior]|uniref:Uncharacterized protein n=1 Tax=Cardiocondyla obscurior TaxID=286306 RepID=A0AAW2F4F9_9HYME
MKRNRNRPTERKPCCAPLFPVPGATFTREYTRQRSTDCVGAPRLPPSTPRTVQQTRSSAKACAKKKRKGNGRERRLACASDKRRKTPRREERRGVCNRSRDLREKQAKRVCKARGLSASSRVCSVSRVHGTSAACPRPPEL